MTTPPDWDFELQALRSTAHRAGIKELVRPRDAGVTLESVDELLARLIGTEETPVVDELAARRRRRLRTRVLVASSVAAVGVLVAGVVQPFGADRVEAATPQILDYEFASAGAISYAPGQNPTAAFTSLAAASANATDPGSAQGRAQHVVTDNWFAEIENDQGGDGSSALVPQISETTLGSDGSLRLVERRDQPLAQDGRGLPQDGAWDDQPQTADETQPAGSVDADLADDLSTRPDKLRGQLEKIGGCTDTPAGTDHARCLYDQVVQLTRTYVVRPELYSAIWTVLGQEKGFRLLGSVKDRAGREGIGISLIADSSPEYRLVLIADPEDGEVLGNEEILIHSVSGLKIDAPAITSFSAILDSEYVD